MNNLFWEQTRSNFNHTWLKNRLLIAIRKAQNVLLGKVEDESIWEDLYDLLMEWQERHSDAQMIFTYFSTEASPAIMLNQSCFSSLDNDLREWLRQLVDQRWKEIVRYDAKLFRAKTALSVFDREVQILSDAFLAFRKGQGQECHASCLATFEKAAQELAQAFSDISSTRA